jgi:hypothetical protein
LRKPTAVRDFVEQTQVAMVTGFTRDVDWIESSSFELLLFKAFHTFKSPRVVIRHLQQKYPDLVESTGFKFFPEIDMSETGRGTPYCYGTTWKGKKKR